MPSESDRFARPRALHPISVVLGVPLAQLVQALFLPAAAVFATGGAVTVGLLGIVLVVGLVARVLAWQRFRYSFDGEVLRVSSGVLSRSHRSLDVGRIQQVEIDRPFLHRLARVATVRIETAGSASEPEVELRVLSETDAVALRHAVRRSREAVTGDSGPAAGGPELVLRVPNRHVALGAVTGVQLLLFPAVIGGALQFLGGPATDFLQRAVEWTLAADPSTAAPTVPTPATVLVALALLVVLSVIVAVVVGLVREGNFRIERQGEDLVLRRGLLGTRDSTVPLSRVQLVEVLRNPVRRALGFAVVRIHSAGGSGAAERRVGVPLVPDRGIDSLLGELVAGLDGIPALLSHPVQARRRALWRWLRPAVTLAAGLWVATTVLEPSDVVTAGAGVLATVLVIGAAVLAVVEYRLLGHALTDRAVVARRGALTVTVGLMPLGRIQAVSSRANLFQRRLGLACVTAHVAGPGGDLEILDTGTAVARDVHERLVLHAASAGQPTVLATGAEDTR